MDQRLQKVLDTLDLMHAYIDELLDENEKLKEEKEAQNG